MFNFTEAFTYIFKEKNWGFKFILPFILQLLIVLPGLLTLVIDPSSTTTTFQGYNMMTTQNSNTSFLGLFISLITCCAIIPYIVVNLWYMYENIQAGIFQRHTKAIWESKFDVTLKKTGKYVLTSAVYGLFMLFTSLVVFGIICVIGLALMTLGTAIMSPANATTNTSLGGSLVALVVICGAAVLFIVGYFVYYIWMQTGLLRLIATDSFSEGLKLTDNWHLAMKHKSKFLGLIAVIFFGALTLGFGYAIIGLAAGIIGLTSPVINFGVQAILQIIVALITTYLTYFVYPRLLGQVFRQIIKEDDSLKFIKL